ncbi:MAG: FAD-binding oxidoreductase [Saprospiraceae bacterium]|nr:FAD-binding oxidoreductase [Saprospiraceae bacterium]
MSWRKRLLNVYKTQETASHEATLANEALKYGCRNFHSFGFESSVYGIEVKVDALGGVYFPIDCHLHPVKMMHTLSNSLVQKGVKFCYNQEVKDFIIHNKVNEVITNKGNFLCDHVVIRQDLDGSTY